MVAVTGAFGRVASRTSGTISTAGNLHTVKNWSLTVETSPPTYRASNTKLGTGRVAGRFDWSGTFEQITLAPDTMLWPGNEISIQLYTAPDSGIPESAGRVYTGTAIISEIALTWNWRDEEIPMTVISFQAASVLVEDVGTPPTDNTIIPDPVSICGLKIKYYDKADPAVLQEWYNVARAELRFTAENTEVNNSSNYVPAGCYVDRTRGPIDFNLSILEDNDAMLNLGSSVAASVNHISIQDNPEIRLYTNSALSTYWKLQWAHIMSVNDLTVDIETGKIIEQTVNLGMQGFRYTDEGDDEQITGQIVHPDTTVLWPNTSLFP
jgi:hypothetical protein